MERGPELDSLVIEKVLRIPCFTNVLAWANAGRPYPHCILEGNGVYYYRESAHAPGIPISPSMDISCAWQVVEEMQAQNFTFEIERHACDVGKQHGWRAKFGRLGLGIAKEAPEAICLAAIQAAETKG